MINLIFIVFFLYFYFLFCLILVFSFTFLYFEHKQGVWCDIEKGIKDSGTDNII